MVIIYKVDNKGITYLELIIYIVLIGIFLSLSIPTSAIIKDARFKADCRNLLNDIKSVKQMTQLDFKIYKINFFQEGYNIEDDKSQKIKNYIFSKGVRLENTQLSRGSSKVNFMSYNLDGTGYASGTLVISNQDGSQKIKITIVPVTGRSTIVSS